MTLLGERHRIRTAPSPRSVWKRLGGSAIEPSASLPGRGDAVDRNLINADAPPQRRYRELTLPKLRFGRVKLVVFSEKCLIRVEDKLGAPFGR